MCFLLLLPTFLILGLRQTPRLCSFLAIHIILAHQFLFLFCMFFIDLHSLAIEFLGNIGLFFIQFLRYPIQPTLFQVALEFHFSQHLLILKLTFQQKLRLTLPLYSACATQ